MTSMKSNLPAPAAKTPSHFPAAGSGPAAAGRPAVKQQSVAIPVETGRERDDNRIILYERLSGEAARQRATAPEPRGAGMPPEAVEKVEYVEVWSTPNPPEGYDFRMYSFGGALIASRSTRSL